MTQEQTIGEEFIKEFECDCQFQCGEFEPDLNNLYIVADWWIKKLSEAVADREREIRSAIMGMMLDKTLGLDDVTVAKILNNLK